ncbi:hypothetical protein LJY25_16015 [Hymenobacter sp. BT175]|uniref:hypothetical protein n=1 Tax=Hymenobacter translucens TaxID=2886507 RepID=UPI001D0DCEC5|nr:hypothetical protein [Hymenobacter translucens]MCC2547955.1 hypothetical protein [Hymenobacter translucens]
MQLPGGIMRLTLPYHLGRKTFVTLRIAKGVPSSQVMMTTGHQPWSSFNHYLGINEAELLDAYRKATRRVANCSSFRPASAYPET